MIIPIGHTHPVSNGFQEKKLGVICSSLAWAFTGKILWSQIVSIQLLGRIGRPPEALGLHRNRLVLSMTSQKKKLWWLGGLKVGHRAYQYRLMLGWVFLSPRLLMGTADYFRDWFDASFACTQRARGAPIERTRTACHKVNGQPHEHSCPFSFGGLIACAAAYIFQLVPTPSGFETNRILRPEANIETSNIESLRICHASFHVDNMIQWTFHDLPCMCHMSYTSSNSMNPTDGCPKNFQM